MKRDSKELAERIDAETAYQNGEDMQFRSRTGGGSWIDLKEGGTLSFNWAASEFRVKPVLIEGWVRKGDIHANIGSVCDINCVHVREIKE